MKKAEQDAFWRAADDAAKAVAKWPKWKQRAAAEILHVDNLAALSANVRRYPDTDPRTLEPFFSQHMEAMTAEGLHDKGDIAIQLAARDKRISELEAALHRDKTGLPPEGAK